MTPTTAELLKELHEYAAIAYGNTATVKSRRDAIRAKAGAIFCEIRLKAGMSRLQLLASQGHYVAGVEAGTQRPSEYYLTRIRTAARKQPDGLKRAYEALRLLKEADQIHKTAIKKAKCKRTGAILRQLQRDFTVPLKTLCRDTGTQLTTLHACMDGNQFPSLKLVNWFVKEYNRRMAKREVA